MKGYHIYINEEFKYSRILNTQEVYHFIDGAKNNITKIFINSIIGHDWNFISHLFTLNKYISSLTHDYSLFMIKPSPYHHEFNNSLRNGMNVNVFDSIITQNMANIYLYGGYVAPNRFMELVDLPDYQNPLERIIIAPNATKIIVGVIGYIYEGKGSNIIIELYNFIRENNLSIEIFIFGYIAHPKINCKWYDNIRDLNKLLINVKPNIMLYPALLPETYSYTLSLEKITDLPIIYWKNNFYSTIENRLENYPKAYPTNNIEDMVAKIIKYRQDYFYTIEPKVYISNFWTNLFSERENIVLITSKIFVSAYSNHRSIYTWTERFNQTLATITSIRLHISNAYIVMIDNSDFSNHVDMKNDVVDKVDYFINPFHVEDLDYCTDMSQYRQIGECAQLLHAINFVRKHNFKNYFKISGRYIINDMFNYSLYHNSENIFKECIDSGRSKYFHTCFYKIANNKFVSYYNALEQVVTKCKTNNEYAASDFGCTLPLEMNYDFQVVDTLGVTHVSGESGAEI